MIVQTNLVPSLIEASEEYYSEFHLIDSYFKPSQYFDQNSPVQGRILYDTEWENDNDSSINWKLIGGKSYKECELDGLEQPDPLAFDFQFI